MTANQMFKKFFNFFKRKQELKPEELSLPVFPKLTHSQFVKMQQEINRLIKVSYDIQSKQIDAYFENIISKNIDPFLIGLYREEKVPIPGLENYVNVIHNLNPQDLYFAKHLEIFLNKKKIGDALFKAKIENGFIKCLVEDNMKMPENVSPGISTPTRKPFIS